MNTYTDTMHAPPADAAGIRRRTRRSVGAEGPFPTSCRPRYSLTVGGATLSNGGAACRW
jgi:hypothetical protein